MAGGRERRSRERPSGSERDAQGDVRCLQAADDGVAAMASQDSDGSELELAMKYSEVLGEMDDEDDRVLEALWAQAKANKESKAFTSRNVESTVARGSLPPRASL